MDDDTQAIAIGLGAGLGGFAGLLLIGCICWQILCGSWCEKKKVQARIKPIPAKNQRHITTVTKAHNNVSTMTAMKNTNVDPDLKPNPANDLAIEIRFHISDHYFICTPEQVNEHMIVYLIGESVPYDKINNQYLCESQNHACKHFQEKTWAYCESANENSGYSILRRQFLLMIEKYKPIQLRYSSCCWANSSDKHFYFDLSIETKLNRNNSSPYPYIPTSYYVDFNKPKAIKIFVYDADDDEIVCERFEEDLGRFLTVNVDNNCTLTYQTNRFGKQFGQFWLMDRNKNQILSRSLISIQVFVLKDIICNIQPEIIVESKEDRSNMSTIRIKESVYISVSLNPNCLLIEPQDQTITELTTLCTNKQPVVLANGGIEVIFECSPTLCEKYQVCFVGEFGLKLPSTEIKCFSIEIIGTGDECAHAVSNYNFLKPHNRHFIIAEPITQKQSATISTTSSKSSPSKLWKTTTTLPRSHSRVSLSSGSKFRSWMWILVVLIFFLLIGFTGYFGFKHILRTFNRYSLDSDQFHSSSRSDSRTTIKSDLVAIYPGMKQISTSSAQYNQYDNSPDLSQKAKVRAQRIQLGTLLEDD
ncbi:unnamed protein product [Rotaria sp. Silwood1]|nr:unnamed protein product [Rotaria sp. Silwood1]CAF3345613.1 unnamed protein product [Rotaria sp. Silwood1]CAF4520480.1 unnamed protein product [Rotaria sp. Silwood1]CAF4566137.1 unnamed protein product [Rotaria sp. Silwood1]